MEDLNMKEFRKSLKTTKERVLEIRQKKKDILSKLNSGKKQREIELIGMEPNKSKNILDDEENLKDSTVRGLNNDSRRIFSPQKTLKGALIPEKREPEKKETKLTNKLIVIPEESTKFTIKVVDFIIFVLVIIQITLALTENDIFNTEIKEGDKITKASYTLTDTVYNIRVFLCGVVAVIEILLITRYYLKLKLMRQIYLACPSDGLYSTGLLKWLLLEFIILGSFCPPNNTDMIHGAILSGSFSYSVDAIINFFVMWKIYYFVKIYGNISLFTSDRIKRIAKKHKINIGSLFAFKAQLKKYPYLTLLFLLVVSVGIFGFNMRTFEYGFTSNKNVGNDTAKSVKNQTFKFYLDAFWVVIITMMTVGFGDIFPNTHLGRCVAFISAIVGMVIVSLLIVTMSTLVEFTSEEKKAHSLIKKNNITHEMKNTARILICNILKLNAIKKKNEKNKLPIFLNHVLIIRAIVVKFTKEYKISKTQFLPSDEILVQLQRKLETDVKFLKSHEKSMENIKKLTKTIAEDEKKILNALQNLKEKQDEISNFLVKYNNEIAQPRLIK